MEYTSHMDVSLPGGTGTKRIWIWRCVRCGKVWPVTLKEAPKTCPDCHSPFWYKPRTRKNAIAGSVDMMIRHKRKRESGVA